jgi:hypothetical protein
MYHMLRRLFMDDHDSYTIISLSLLYSFVKCSLHADSIFTPEHVLSRMVSPSLALLLITLYILGFDLYTVSTTLVDAT